MFCPRCHRRYDPSHLYCTADGERLHTQFAVGSFPAKPTRQNGVILGGRYEVRGFIGKGAMARVYLAEDVQTRGPVAVKVLDPLHVKNEATRERFIREAQAATRIGHTNIVRVLDVGVRGSDRAPYLVMEFLFGESLGEWLRRERVMTIDVGLPIAAQIADGLAAAHAAGIVHRDVKPDNIFLVGEPGAPYGVKIVDFGFAKVRGEQTFTQGVAIGTLEYMAPEQTVSDQPSPATDVYGLGIVMYRMFKGALPWPEVEDADLLAHQLAAAPPSPGLAAEGLDPRLDSLILKAIRKHPKNRYATMDELLEDLERIGGRREGALLAEGALVVDPDRYEPDGQFSRAAARYLYKRIGVEPPAW
jgi:eukaryotic-like serine/threonine-protein kinase